MASQSDLRSTLLRLDGKGYRAYRDIEGVYQFPQFTLSVDHVQTDPFAPPSAVTVRMPQDVARYPEAMLATRTRRVALADYLARSFRSALYRVQARDLAIDAGGQVVVERTAATTDDGGAELRFTAQLPGRGRTIMGRAAATLLTEVLPQAVMTSLPYAALDAAAMQNHVWTIEDAQALRNQLTGRGLLAFVADGAILPRQSGASDLPLRDRVIEFRSPDAMRVTLDTPHSGPISGMGIREGITLIVGGGYHGKTTLLQTLQVGVYDHIPGDGRERVVTVADAVKVRSEDGRRVEKVDISPFLDNLPFDVDTTSFSTDDASGSTSLAAAIMETLEVGTRLLLLDEDTSATNFMVRDDLMQQLVPKELEPITPYLDRVRELRDRGISTIMVIGGDGDYFEVADNVIMMERYRPRDVTAHAHAIARQFERRRYEPVMAFETPIPRIPLPSSINPETPHGRTKVRVQDLDAIRFGREAIEIPDDQLIEVSQTRAIGSALVRLVDAGYVDGRHTVSEALELLYRDIDADGLGAIAGGHRRPPGNLARPRPHDVAAALNRLRSLEVRQQRPDGGINRE